MAADVETCTEANRGGPMAGQAPRRLLFPRGARIKQGRDFRRVRQGGERLICGCLVANWSVLGSAVGEEGQALPAQAATRLGVVTSGRIGGAVVRNRARRLLREAFRLHQDELARPVELVLVTRPSIAGKTFAAVERDFLTALRKARLLR
jgi:ribonuclease P protein component